MTESLEFFAQNPIWAVFGDFRSPPSPRGNPRTRIFGCRKKKPRKNTAPRSRPRTQRWSRPPVTRNQRFLEPDDCVALRRERLRAQAERPLSPPYSVDLWQLDEFFVSLTELWVLKEPMALCRSIIPGLWPESFFSRIQVNQTFRSVLDVQSICRWRRRMKRARKRDEEEKTIRR